jgi:hypothetical protein
MGIGIYRDPGHVQRLEFVDGAFFYSDSVTPLRVSNRSARGVFIGCHFVTLEALAEIARLYKEKVKEKEKEK